MIKEKEYIKNIDLLFTQLFGEENSNLLGGNRLGYFKCIFNYGIQQVKDHELPDTQKMYNLIVKSDYSKVGVDSKEEENSYEDCMELVKEKTINLYGEGIYKILMGVKMKPIKWEGLNITTSSITATSPCIKQRFRKRWLSYYSERGYTLFDLFIQSAFHFGYQHGIYTIIKPMKDEISKASDELSRRMDIIFKD